MKKLKPVFFFVSISTSIGLVLGGCGSWGSASAEEYFSIGMAYYDMGKYEEAEKWLIRAKAKDKTKNASEYNLGRIAFEVKRYDEAVKYFEAILKRDPNNVLALKAAAYTHIKNGDIAKASDLYKRLLAIVPESSDDGYNYALVLFAMKNYEEAEKILKTYGYALLDNSEVLLLLARAQKEQGKPEAIDTYAAWLVNNSDAKVRHEYAQLLEGQQMYARALEEYRTVYTALSSSSTDPAKAEVKFAIARLMLTADAVNKEGVTELKTAVGEGYNDFDKIEQLLASDKISVANKNEIRTIVTEGRRALEAQRAEAEKAAAQKAEAEKNQNNASPAAGNENTGAK